jgi:alpha-N-acetylglucosaminidase
VVYEYIYDLSWSAEGIAWKDWIKQYTLDRYGYTSDGILTSWDLLKESVFQTRYWTPRWWKGGGAYLLFKRPTASIVEFTGYPSDKQQLRKALQFLLKETEKNKTSTLLAHDLVEFTRHYMSMHIDSVLVEAVKAYTTGNIPQGDALANKTFLAAAKLDTLIGVQHLNVLGTWLEDASRYGDNAQESELYIQNARTQITIWGGDNLKDYASKSWQGMYKDFYVPRWKMFFEAMKKAHAAGKKFDEEAVRKEILTWEENWDNRKDIPVRIDTEETAARVAELLKL